MKICLDSGHYKNYNQGAVSKYYEGNVVWQLTNLQKKLLEDYENVEVVLTREYLEKDLSLTNRGLKAKNCDLFISNHTNWVNNSSVTRAVIFHSFDNKNNSKVLANELGKVITDTMGLTQDYQVTTRMYQGGEYYTVLANARKVGCPYYYIIEHSFHSNFKVCNWLLNHINLEKLARAEVETIAKHFKLSLKANNSSNQTKYSKYVVNTDKLNVRVGRGVENYIIGLLSKGEIIDIWYIGNDSLGQKWGSFRYTSTKVGYFNMSYLKPIFS